MGEAAMAEEPGVGPPKGAEKAPAPGRPAVVEIEVRGEEEASREVAEAQGEELLPEAQAIARAEAQGKASEFRGEVRFMAGHGGRLWGGAARAATLRVGGRGRTMFLAPKTLNC